uniref:AGE family epimerase/isomerase n=1 Tax=uncultured Erythrobacter sp. TaxID=263913 RepID=UPI002637FE21|nr:AGE family epimerase/isomerase [uncultured Erythrobacter sp.]
MSGHSDIASQGEPGPTVAADLQACATHAKAWMFGKAFPYWAARSWSDEGAFFETLTMTGDGFRGRESRVRVQARQVYSFALAAKLGWDEDAARDLVVRGLKVLSDQCRREDGLYGARIKPGCGLSDERVHLYDNAFALLAFATALDAFGLDEARTLGQKLSENIDRLLKRPAQEGGYKECLPAPTRREQNPHMHLCEASIAWFAASGDEASLARAKSVAEFVEARFFDRDLGVLVEFVDPSEPKHVEAGHMFEWVWIMQRLETLARGPISDWKSKLYAGGLQLMQGNARTPLLQEPGGKVLDGRQRTWILTEELKAHIAIARGQLDDAQIERIGDCTDRLFSHHLLEGLGGGWLDCVDAQGEPAVGEMTAASGYHVFCCLAELMDIAGVQEPHD